jgi:hypothetical protein
MRAGIISLISGLIGGSWAFFHDARHRHIPVGKTLVFYYITKVGSACLSAYLAVLGVPIFGVAISAETEQLISILAAVLGADFIGLLMRRVLGVQPKGDAWNGEERRAAQGGEG